MTAPESHRCNGTCRYAIRCRNRTADPSGLCHLHRDQEWLDVRTEQGAKMAGRRYGGWS